MNALSSVRPLRECAATRNRTIEANRSWVQVFDRIVYFGSPSMELSAPNVGFLVSEQFPRIKTVCELAASLTGWTAIINGDIVVGRRMKEVEAALTRRRATCAISRRYEFDRSGPRFSKVVDLGLDFFVARQDLWAKIAETYPDHYRFGHSSWDALMLGAFNYFARSTLYDMTGWRVIFHPKHGERRQIYRIQDDVRTEFRDCVIWPRQKL